MRFVVVSLLLLSGSSCSLPPRDGAISAVVSPTSGPSRQDGPCDCGPIALVAPAFIDFGPVQLGDAIETELVVSNVGSEDLIVERLVFQGPDDFRFEEVGAEAEDMDSFVRWRPPLVIAPGDSVTMRARFAPLVDLGVTGLLLLHTNEPPGRPAPSLVVTGEGAQECPLIVSDAVEFGSVPVGIEAVGRVDLVGCADTGVRVVDIRLSSDADSAISLDLAGIELPLSLLPHEKVSLYVRYLPEHATGIPEQAELLITTTHHDADVGVRLFGFGI